jgi:hypothetical protein
VLKQGSNHQEYEVDLLSFYRKVGMAVSERVLVASSFLQRAVTVWFCVQNSTPLDTNDSGQYAVMT